MERMDDGEGGRRKERKGGGRRERKEGGGGESAGGEWRPSGSVCSLHDHWCEAVLSDTALVILILILIGH